MTINGSQDTMPRLTSARATPLVSVVIPCFNQGVFLSESIASVQAQSLCDFEIIVVDDGSTDAATARALEDVSPCVRVIRTENHGLAAARNSGIREARGKYILPLDADDKLGSTYLEKAAGILETDPRIGIVYCHAEFFGATRGRWELPPYSFPKILISPQIFATSMFRKSAWERAGGFSPEMRLGWEDYDFWLTLIENGAGVHCIPEVLFYYRSHKGSMISRLTREDYVGMYVQLFRRHERLYVEHIDVLFREILATWDLRHRSWRARLYNCLSPILRFGRRLHDSIRA